jgi:predicted phage terminase large subunit-like protein
LRWIQYPSFRGIIFRRTFPELEKSIVDRSRQLYKAVAPGAEYNGQEKTWRFPSGARIYFGHLEHEHSVHAHQSAEYQFIGFDELTHFTEKQYVYMLSRARSSAGLPVRIRSASNPGGPGHEWVKKRWGRWLDRNHPEPVPAETVLYYINTENGEEFVPEGTHGALSRCFIPGRLEDNPHLTENDPGYRQRVMGQDAVTRAQLLHGDWMIRPAAGLYFKRQWFNFLDEKPANVVRKVRRWDLASTEGGGDWTVGVLMSRTESNHYVVENVVRGRWRPEGVQRTVRATAAIDGKDVVIHIPQDPGQAGVDQRDAYAKLLTGYNCRFARETGDKLTRAQPFSAQCEAGRVDIVKAPWNEPFMQCLEAFGEEDVQDDDVDAAAGAFNVIYLKDPMTLADGPITEPVTGGRVNESADDDDEEWD